MSQPSQRSSFRCAVYTRKSSEEGLDMAFNSLDAQREAGTDYIKSQRHQGWTMVTTAYDDGGYSGGSTDRPGLQKLLADIQAGRVDIVVVYKVDRLSRSLTDFARLMQLFDEHHVSFVSVTQQFNTTTSMGRLTLNMLLSFAQFEREVAGERIRDKIAATKRKGVWVCGQPPLGYRLLRDGDKGFTPGDRTLRIVDDEAKLVRLIFEGYAKDQSLVRLSAILNAEGYRTRRWTSSTGKVHGGRTLNPHYLYGILTNPVYIGKITHKLSRARLTSNTAPRRKAASPNGQDHSSGEIWPGLHKPIIEQALWDRVHAAMGKVERVGRETWTHSHLLRGKLKTFEGFTMSPSSTQRKATKRDVGPDSAPKRHIAYYVSQKAIREGYRNCPIKSLNAQHLDDLVRSLVVNALKDRHVNLDACEPSARDQHIRACLRDVVVATDALTVDINVAEIRTIAKTLTSPKTSVQTSKRPNKPEEPVPECVFKSEVEEHDGVLRLTLRLQIRRHDGRRVLLSPEGHDLTRSLNAERRSAPEQHIVHAIGLAYVWREEMLRTGEGIREVAQRWRVTEGRVHQLLNLTQLGPDVLQGVLSSRSKAPTALDDLIETSTRLRWSKQNSD